MRSAVISLTDRPRGRVEHVLVIDDHPLFCEALAMTLAGALEGAQVTIAHSLGEGVTKMQASAPDAVLLDLNLPDVTGFEGLVRLKATAPGLPIIVVSSMQDSRIITSAIASGAAGFIPKHSPREVFVEAFSRIWSGGTFTPEGYVAPDSRRRSGPAPDAAARLAELTTQQARILDLVCEGKLNKQIAYELSIAETTVKAHITAILRKLGVQSRTQAVLIASRASFASILHDRSDPD